MNSNNPVQSSKSPGRKPSKSNSRQGLFSLNEKELRSELKRIELSKRQYETLYSHEQRKVITRFATKLARSSSTLENIINQDFSSTCTTPSLQRTPTFFEPRQNISIKSLLKSNDDASISSQDGQKVKKNVKWNPDLFNTEDSDYNDTSSLTVNLKNRPSFYDVNKKYDELRLTLSNPPPKVMLPHLISANRRSNSEIGGFKQSSNYYFDVHKSTLENKNKFLHALETEETGFQSYKNCLGYDNFRNLLSSSANISSKEANDLSKGKAFKNPFNQVSPPATPRVKSGVKKSDLDQLRSTPDSVRQLIIENRKKDEDDKMCLDTFKAQNIRSLTYKHITTY